jgi:hypothetical protein
MLSVVHGIGYHQWELTPEEARTALIVGLDSTGLVSLLVDISAVRLRERNLLRARWSWA